MFCPYRTVEGSCQHVDSALGELVILHDDVCSFCIRNFKDPETRATGAPVLHSICTEKRKRGLHAETPPPFVPPPTTSTANRDHRPRKNIADQMLAVAKSVPRITRVIPIIADP